MVLFPPRVACSLALAALLLLPAALRAEEIPVGGEGAGAPNGAVAFLDDLPKAFEAAKAQDKVLMICVNSKRVDGRGRIEPAAKELRERTYKSPVIGELSKKFVCCLLSGESTADDFGELRARYQIDGLIVSPQHLFAYPNGELIFREEYWPYGTGAGSVKALKEMMDKALMRDRARRGDTTTPEGAGKIPEGDDGGSSRPVPEDPEQRAQWITEQLALVRSRDENVRDDALEVLLDADTDGTILQRILGLLEASKKDVPVQISIVRALGRPELEAAHEAVEDFLDHKDDALRANAAVTLEYIGSEASTTPLQRQVSKEKDDAIANHLYRALGRCGHAKKRVQKILIKKAQGGKSRFACYGPIIGLSYCEGEKGVRRNVEKLLKREGVPSGRRGGWRGSGKRALLTWCLTEIGDEKTARFFREDMMRAVPDSDWKVRYLDFFQAAAEAVEGDVDAKSTVETGVVRALSSGGGRGGRGRGSTPRPRLQDDARMGRHAGEFQPKGEFGSS